MSDKINLTLEREIWNSLARFAHQQSIAQGKRFTVIETLRTAVNVFLRLKVSEINEILERATRNHG